MSDLKSKLDKIILDIEKNLKNKEDLEYVKTQIYNIYTIFLNEIDEMEAKYDKKVEDITLKCKFLDDRINEIEESIGKIKSDIYIYENEEYDFDITCPYCDTEFSIDFSNGPQEVVKCPECNKTIELDWNEHDECSHDCHECNGGCHHHDEIEEENDEDDDM